MIAPPREQPSPHAQARRPAATLTSRGWGLVSIAVASIAAADILGVEELYAVAGAAVVLLAYAVVWSATRKWRIDVGRRLQPPRIEAGAAGLVVVTLHNRADSFSPVLTLRDHLGAGHQMTEMAVAPLGPEARLSGSYRLPVIGRGVMTLGPLALEATDPFGLARRTRSSNVVSTYIVHPRVERLRAPRVAVGTDRNRGTALPISGQGNDEFASLREYQLGDDFRRMHWVSTARTDTLMVREDQLERRGQFSVLLDTRSGSWAPASFERAVSAAASIGCAALDAGLHTRVLTTAGVDSGAGAGRNHRSHLLDLLARTECSGPDRGPAAGGPSLPAGGTVAVVTSDAADLEELRRSAGGGIHADVIFIVFDRASSAPPAGARARAAQAVGLRAGGARRSGAEKFGATRRSNGGAGRIVRVGPDTPLAAVWDPMA
jgi:uncharacterized protein (DUF58 family)